MFSGNTPTTGTAISTNQPYNPASAFSPYMSQQVEAQQVQVGSTLASALSLTPGSHAIGEVMQHFEEMTPAELRQLEVMLWQGGFYVDAQGNPLPTPPTFGSRDSQSFDALINAALVASQGSSSLDQAIQNNIGQGVGANLRSNLPQAVTGGANFYTINLANPADVHLAANNIFQAALGRNATDAEVANITSTLHSQTLSQGFSQQAAHENLSRTQYQTGLNQRNAAYQYETTPKIAAGAIPNSVTNPSDFAISLLQYMGLPVTASNVQFIMGWQKASGQGLSGNNPLGVMLSLSGATPSQQGGPPQYSSWAQGFQATAQALQSGPYANTLAALSSGDATGLAGMQNVTQEIGKWSSGAYTNLTKQADGFAKQARTAIQSVTVTAAGALGGNLQGGQTATPPAPAGQPTPQNARNQQMAGQLAGTPTPGATPTSVAPTTPSSVLPASATTVNPADVNPGQQVTNPTDTYINPATSITTNPASAEAASYQAATTGANRAPYLGNQYLQAYQAVLAMIKSGGPTSG